MGKFLIHGTGCLGSSLALLVNQADVGSLVQYWKVNGEKMVDVQDSLRRWHTHLSTPILSD